MPPLYTVGHSTRTIGDFLDLLRRNEIQTLVDVRHYPGSRRYPHFGQAALRASLAIAGIEYIHLVELGGRRQPRPDSHNTAWRNAAFRGYADYMETPPFQAGIELLTETAKSSRTAIMCSEAVWWRCHRSLIADYLKSRGWDVLHILAPDKLQPHPYTSAAQITNGELSYASAAPQLNYIQSQPPGATLLSHPASPEATDLTAIRLRQEQREREWLDPRAARSSESKGRARPEPPDPYRTQWQRDRDRIIHTKAFRRLKHKTQVFISPEQDHYRTRLTHTLEVTQISRTVARALNLNEDLVEAIGMGHDLGHAPFGHIGEEALDKAYRAFDPESRFRHYEQSLRIVDVLEKEGDGLNLTWEVRDGILHHSKGRGNLDAGKSIDLWLQRGKPATLEGQIVRICDRVAYVNHDIDDAVRGGLIKPDDIPRDCLSVLGQRHAERITNMVNAILEASSEVVDSPYGPTRQVLDHIAMRDDVMEATDALKNWMFANVYQLHTVQEAPKVNTVIRGLFEQFMDRPDLMREHTPAGCEDVKELSPQALARCVCDHISGMTDRFASQTYMHLFMPLSWRGV